MVGWLQIESVVANSASAIEKADGRSFRLPGSHYTNTHQVKRPNRLSNYFWNEKLTVSKEGRVVSLCAPIGSSKLEQRL